MGLKFLAQKLDGDGTVGCKQTFRLMTSLECENEVREAGATDKSSPCEKPLGAARVC
jgi:hypothetical protein